MGQTIQAKKLMQNTKDQTNYSNNAPNEASRKMGQLWTGDIASPAGLFEPSNKLWKKSQK